MQIKRIVATYIELLNGLLYPQATSNGVPKKIDIAPMKEYKSKMRDNKTASINSPFPKYSTRKGMQKNRAINITIDNTITPNKTWSANFESFFLLLYGYIACPIISMGIIAVRAIFIDKS